MPAGRHTERVAGDEQRRAQERINAFWNAVADAYESDPANVPTPGSWEEGVWTEAVRSLLPEPPADVLDVGTGSGFLARIAAAGHRVTAIELAAEMLEVARARSGAEGLTIEFAPGDAVAPALPAASFDAVTNRSLIWTLREVDVALADWCALLRAGGRVICLYGLSTMKRSEAPAKPSDESRASFFEQHYTPATQALLPAIGLQDHDLLLRAATAAGFIHARVIPADVVGSAALAPGSAQPYALIADRA